MEHHVEVRSPRRPGRLRPSILAFVGCLVLGVACTAYVLGVFTRHATPYEALDAYTSAVASGDRDALGAAVADSPRRQALIDRHAGKPMTPTRVSMETMVSGVWWSVEIRFELPGQPPDSERLIVHPRDDSPDRLVDYVVEPAP